MANSARPAAVGFIFVTLLLDIIGLGIIIPVIPQLIQELTGADVANASRYGGWLLFASAFFQFLFAPLVGALSGALLALAAGWWGLREIMRRPVVETLRRAAQ